MTNLTQWKKEAAEDLENERFGWMEFDKASGSRFLNTDKVEAFLNTLIDRIHAHTLEEVRDTIRSIRHKNGLMPLGFSDDPYNKTLDRIVGLLELLEHPTD